MRDARFPDTIIVGGGVIGCGIAYELAKRGVNVLILERDLLGSGASYASAGMLAPLSDSTEPAALQQLGAQAFRMYPKFLEEIEEAGSMRVECMPSGIIRTAMAEEEFAALKDCEEAADELGLELQWLTGDEARKTEPLIGPDVIAATFSGGEPQLSPSRLVETLRRAATSHGAEFREHTQVVGLIRQGNRITGVRLADEVIHAKTVILAMGSWSCFASQWLGLDVPVYPVRGQVVYANKLRRPLRHTVMHGMSYATPKGDGTTLLGTTLEQAGFDTRVTVAGVASIFSGILGLLPAFGDTTINHTRAGLRPWSKDNLPLLGAAPGVEGVVIAAGHYRSGILLAPVTAQMIADVITKDGRGVDLGPFSATRLESHHPSPLPTTGEGTRHGAES